jgi:hypothetical protein
MTPIHGALDIGVLTSALFSWEADATLKPVSTGADGSVTRATAGTSVDSRGHNYTSIVNQPRWNACDTDGDGVTDDIGLLIEPIRTNLVLQSENFGTTWTATNSPTRTPAAHTTSQISLDLIGDTSASTRAFYEQSITFTGDAIKTFSIVFRKHTQTTITLVRIYDGTSSADVLSATVGWSGTGPAVTTATGTYLGTQALMDGVYRLLFQTTSVTSAHTHNVQVSPAALTASDNTLTGAVYAGGVQAEDASSPSSYIKTTTATVTRGTETCSFPILFAPQNLTVSGIVMWPGITMRAAAAAESSGASHGIFALGDSSAAPGREVFTLEMVTVGTTAEAKLAHLVNGTGATVQLSLAGLTSPLRYIATVHADSSVTLSVTGGNGVTNVLSSTPPAILMQSTFYGGHLWIGSREGGTASGGLTTRSLSIAAGSEAPLSAQQRTGVGSVAFYPSYVGHGTVPVPTFSGIGHITAAVPVLASTGTTVGGSLGGAGVTYAALDFNTMTASGPAIFTGSPNDDSFWNPWSVQIDVIPDPTGAGRGNVGRIFYSNNPDGFFYDDNKALLVGPVGPPPTASFQIAAGQEVWFQGDFYIDNDTVLALRKLIYWGTSSNQDPSMVVTLSQNGTPTNQQVNLIVNQFTGVGTTDFDPGVVTAKMWVTLKVRLVNNSAANVADGILQIWFNGVQKYSTTNNVWVDSGHPTFAWTSFGTGYQMQTVAVQNSENRYWDNVAFASTEAALVFGGTRSAFGVLSVSPHLAAVGTLSVNHITGTGSLHVAVPRLAGPQSASSTIITSIFPSAVDGTLLQNVADTAGNTWAKTADSGGGSDAVIASGVLYDSGATLELYRFSATPASPDYNVQGTLSGSSNASQSLLALRVDVATGNYYTADYSPYDGIWRLRKTISGVLTTIGAYNASFVSGSVIQFAVSATHLTLIIDGVQQAEAFDSDIAIAGQGGVGFFNAFGGASSSPNWSAWRIECATGFGNSRSGTGALATLPTLAGSGTMSLTHLTGTGTLAVAAPALAGASGGTTTLASTFTSAGDGTDLGSYTDIGGRTWTKTPDTGSPTVAVNGGRFYATSVGGVYYAFSGQPSAADYSVSGSLDTSGASQAEPALVLRAATDYYGVEYDPFNGRWNMFKYVGGSRSEIDHVFMGSGVDATFAVSGTTLTLTVDGSDVLVETDSDISAAGHGGVGYTISFNNTSDSPLWNAWSIHCTAGFSA